MRLFFLVLLRNSHINDHFAEPVLVGPLAFPGKLNLFDSLELLIQLACFQFETLVSGVLIPKVEVKHVLQTVARVERVLDLAGLLPLGLKLEPIGSFFPQLCLESLDPVHKLLLVLAFGTVGLVC